MIARWGREAVAELAAVGAGSALVGPETSDSGILDALATGSGVKSDIHQSRP